MARNMELFPILRLGTTESHLLLAEVDFQHDSDTFRSIGLVSMPTSGMRKGRVIDMAGVTDTVYQALTEAESFSGMEINDLTVIYGGVGVKTQLSQGNVAFTGALREIGAEELEWVHSQAVDGLTYSENYSPVAHLPLTYHLDNTTDIANPTGMTGMRLATEELTMSVPVSDARNVLNSIRKAEVGVRSLLPKGLVAPFGCLNAAEWEGSTVCMSVGGGVMSMTHVRDQRILNTAAIGVGGAHVTNDLVESLQIPFSVADEVKRYLSLFPDRQRDLPAHLAQLSLSDVREVVLSRLEEMIETQLRPFLVSCAYPVGSLVLEGGTVRIDGFAELCSSMTGLPVRIADDMMVAGRRATSLLSGALALRYRQELNPFFAFDMLPEGQDRDHIAVASINRMHGPSKSYASTARRTTAGNGFGEEGIFSKIKTFLKEIF